MFSTREIRSTVQAGVVGAAALLSSAGETAQAQGWHADTPGRSPDQSAHEMNLSRYVLPGDYRRPVELFSYFYLGMWLAAPLVALEVLLNSRRAESDPNRPQGPFPDGGITADPPGPAFPRIVVGAATEMKRAA